MPNAREELTQRGVHADYYHDGVAQPFVARENQTGPLPAGQRHVGRLMAEMQAWRESSGHGEHWGGATSNDRTRMVLWTLHEDGQTDTGLLRGGGGSIQNK